MNALGIIFSELHDKDIAELTTARTLASVPFGGRYRFIDFMLSNMVNSGIDKVGIITKSNYQSLMDHVGSGKSWDLSRKNGGLIVLPPHGEGGQSLFRTRFEAIRSVLSFIRSSNEEHIILSDCDNVCNIDLEEVVDSHVESKADITVVYRKKWLKDSAKNKLVFEVNEENNVNGCYFAHGEGRQNVFTNIMVMKRSFLVGLIEQSAMLGINSFSRDVLIKKHNIYRIHAYRFDGYYASVDSLPNYYRHSIELLDKDKRDSLFNSAHPIFTKVRDSAPTKIGDNARVENSLIADGCQIEGEVINSILFRNVKVAKNARLENCVIMQGTQINEGSRLNAVITDKNVFIKEKRTLSGHEELPYYIGKNKIL